MDNFLINEDISKIEALAEILHNTNIEEGISNNFAISLMNYGLVIQDCCKKLRKDLVLTTKELYGDQ